MGKKISIDSATLMNKVFEVIEAQKIFNIDYIKFKVLVHPKFVGLQILCYIFLVVLEAHAFGMWLKILSLSDLDRVVIVSS